MLFQMDCDNREKLQADYNLTKPLQKSIYFNIIYNVFSIIEGAGKGGLGKGGERLLDAGPADDALAREGGRRRKVSGRGGREKSGDEPYQTERKGEQGGPGEEEEGTKLLRPSADETANGGRRGGGGGQKSRVDRRMERAVRKCVEANFTLISVQVRSRHDIASTRRLGK